MLLKQWGAILFPVLLFFLLSMGLQALLHQTGLAAEKAKALCACFFPLPAALWYHFGETNHQKKARQACAPIPRMAAALTALAVCLALTTAWLNRQFGFCGGTEQPSFLSFVGFCIAGPVTEEILYRGMVLQRCENCFGTQWGVLLSAALFGAAHQTIPGICMAAGTGFVLCLLYLHWRTLAAPIAVHIGVNIIAFFEPKKALPTGVYLLGVLGLSGFLGWLLLKVFGTKKGQRR